MVTLPRESVPVKLDHLRRAVQGLGAYHGWPVLYLAEDIVIADCGPWLRFLRIATDDEVLYALRALQARTRLIGAPRAIRALLDGEVA